MRKIENRDTVWTFRVAEKIAQRTQITLEENTCYWAKQLKPGSMDTKRFFR